MERSIATHPLDRPSDEPGSRPADAPLPATSEVEFELRRLARQRLGRTDDDAAPRTHKSSRSRRLSRQPLVGAFDSPEGFAFVSGETHRPK